MPTWEWNMRAFPEAFPPVKICELNFDDVKTLIFVTVDYGFITKSLKSYSLITKILIIK